MMTSKKKLKNKYAQEVLHNGQRNVEERKIQMNVYEKEMSKQKR